MLFNTHVSQKMRCNNLRALDVEVVQVLQHDAKVTTLYSFTGSLGATITCTWSFDLEALYTNQPKTRGDELISEFTTEEIHDAICHMNRHIAPDPNGFGPSLFQPAWAATGPSLLALLWAFHSQSVQLERINRSFVVLLPKHSKANTLEGFGQYHFKIVLLRGLPRHSLLGYTDKSLT